MADRWHYAHDGNKLGPFSGRQLKDLADADLILPTDTVWKDGTARGVLARRVRNLFTTAPAVATPVDAAGVPAGGATGASPDGTAAPEDPRPAVSPDTPAIAAAAASTPGAGEAGGVPEGHAPGKAEEVAPAPVARPDPRRAPVRRARATAGRGAEVVGQDGTNVKFRKRCTECAYQDTCWNTMRIVNGVTRVSFFCPKCRKSRGAEIHGSLG